MSSVRLINQSSPGGFAIPGPGWSARWRSRRCPAPGSGWTGRGIGVPGSRPGRAAGTAARYGAALSAGRKGRSSAGTCPPDTPPGPAGGRPDTPPGPAGGPPVAARWCSRHQTWFIIYTYI